MSTGNKYLVTILITGNKYLVTKKCSWGLKLRAYHSMIGSYYAIKSSSRFNERTCAFVTLWFEVGQTRWYDLRKKTLFDIL